MCFRWVDGWSSVDFCASTLALKHCSFGLICLKGGTHLHLGWGRLVCVNKKTQPSLASCKPHLSSHVRRHNVIPWQFQFISIHIFIAQWAVCSNRRLAEAIGQGCFNRFCSSPQQPLPTAAELVTWGGEPTASLPPSERPLRMSSAPHPT